MTGEKAMAPPICEHYWAWVSPAGTSESARLCMLCHQPSADWLNEIDAVFRFARDFARTSGDSPSCQCVSCCAYRAVQPPTPCPVCGGAGIVDTSPPGVEHTAPWLQTDMDCGACGGTGEVWLEDDEEFCPRCFAGTESPEHHEKCDIEES